MDRNGLRRILLKRIKAFKGKKEESEKIVKLILDSSEWKEAETILAYSPLSSEVDISPLLSDRRILLPYIENGEMEFAYPRNLRASGLGFMEPEHCKAEYRKALMIIPMLGFNGLCRLGRGGGYYDRYIHENRNRLILWGVAFSVSDCPDLIPEPHDERLDRIISIEDGNPDSQAWRETK